MSIVIITRLDYKFNSTDLSQWNLVTSLDLWDFSFFDSGRNDSFFYTILVYTYADPAGHVVIWAKYEVNYNNLSYMAGQIV